MKHIKTMIVTVILAGMLCTGCGAVGNIKDYSQTVSDANGNSDNMAETEENNVKKETANGVDGTTEKSTDAQEMEEMRCYYKNDDNSYNVTYDDDDYETGYLVQYDLDYTKVMNKVEIKDIFDVVWVTNEWVYYKEYSKEYECSLWRIPIKKTEKGDKLKVSEKEKLFSMDYIDSGVYITDSYIIFFGSGKESESILLYKYEIQDKKYTKLLHMDCGSIMYGEEFPIMIDGMLFVWDDYKIYQLHPDTGDVCKIYQSSDKSNDLYNARVSGGCLYFKDSEKNFYRYNVGDGRVECLISSDSFEKVMEELNLWGEKTKEICIGIGDYYIYNGQVYFEAYAYWKEKDSKTFGKSVWVEYFCEEVLLCAPLDDITNLQCVDAVKKYIDNHTKWDTYEENEDGEQEYYADKEIEIYFVDGKILLYMDAEDHKELFAIYNLDTGKIKEISRKEWDEMWE